MSNTKKSLSRRLTAVALLATLLATGGAVAGGVTSSAQADGIGRCCF
jgi:hypothetical protein